MKSSFIFTLLLVTSAASYAQVGRYEQPSDTTFIGGKTQEDHISRTGVDNDGADLITDLTSLRDSLNVYMSDKNNLGSQNINLTQRKKEMDQMINSLKQNGQNEDLIREGNMLLHQVRQDFKRNR